MRTCIQVCLLTLFFGRRWFKCHVSTSSRSSISLFYLILSRIAPDNCLVLLSSLLKNPTNEWDIKSSLHNYFFSCILVFVPKDSFWLFSQADTAHMPRWISKEYSRYVFLWKRPERINFHKGESDVYVIVIFWKLMRANNCCKYDADQFFTTPK